jgi:small subunit ribosomal protein S9
MTEIHEQTQFHAVGKRKTSIARVFLRPGKGEIRIGKGRSLENYFPNEALRIRVAAPFKVTGTEGQFDLYARLRGGGISGQADALRHGISRALVLYDPNLREPLRKAGFLTRDARVKERKKYGQPGARKRFQFSKR